MNNRLRNIIFTGLLIAISVILNQLLSFYYPPSTSIIKFGIGFVPIIFVSIVFGPKYGVFAGAAADIIGWLLLGAARGAFYFGFTFNAMLYGLVPALLLSFTKKANPPVFFTVNIAIVSVFTLISVLYIFDINAISANTSFTSVYRYVFISIALLSSAILIAISTNHFRNHKTENEFQKVFFIVLVLYLVTSLLLTPIYIQDLYGVSIWAQLPLRIIKMPVEVLLYTVIVEKLLGLRKQLSI